MLMAKKGRSYCLICLCFFSFLTAPAGADQSLPEPAATVPAAAQSRPMEPEDAIESSGLESGQIAPHVPPGNLVTLDPDVPPADLIIRNRNIITLRAVIATLTPKMRARNLRKQFTRAISQGVFSEPTTKVFPPYGTLVLINDQAVASIAYLDLDPLANKTHDQVVAETVQVFSLILDEIREERSKGAMLRAFWNTLLATGALSLTIGIFVYLRRLYNRYMAQKVEATSGAFTRLTKLNIQKVRIVIHRITKFINLVILIFLLFTWLAFVLKQFPYTRPWGEGVWAYVIETFRSMGLFLVNAMPDLFKISLIFLIARGVSKLSARLFEAAESGQIKLPGVHPETCRPTLQILTVIIYIFALVACYPYLPGSSSDAFKGISVLIGVMISIGGSGVINQALSGLVLMYTRAHQVGDYVRIGETEGVVLALDMLATKIRTSKKEEVTIPNSVVLGTSTKNFTRLAGSEGVVLYTSVTIGYDAPWRTVHQLLIEASRRTAGLKKDPPPFVMQTALSDFYVEYQLNAFLEKPETRLPTMATLHANIQDTFNAAGVAIVSPHYVMDPPQPMPPKAVANPSNEMTAT